MITINILNVYDDKFHLKKFSIHILGHASADIKEVNKDCIKVSTFACMLEQISKVYENTCYLSQGKGECSFSIEIKSDIERILKCALKCMIFSLASEQVAIYEEDLQI